MADVMVESIRAKPMLFSTYESMSCLSSARRVDDAFASTATWRGHKMRCGASVGTGGVTNCTRSLLLTLARIVAYASRMQNVRCAV